MNEHILQWFNLWSDDIIYATMFGQSSRFDSVIEIKKSDLQLTKQQDGFIYVWGWPGPDFNIYYFSDYGETWAFSRKELESNALDYSNICNSNMD